METKESECAVDLKRLVRQTIGDDGHGGHHPAAIGGAEERRAMAEWRREVYLSTKKDVLDEYRAAPHLERVDGPSPARRRGPCSRLARWMLGTPRTKLRAAILAFDDGGARKALDKLNREDGPDAFNRSIDEAHGKTGDPPLFVAVKVKNYGAVDLLLDVDRIDMNAVDERGMSALHHAVRVGSGEIVSRMLRLPTDRLTVDLPDASGATPLMIACESGWAGIVRTLLLLEEGGGGANPNRRDDYGWNALFYACYGGHVKAASLVLDAGVDRRCRDEKRYRAYDWANHMGHGAVVSLLETHRSKMSSALAEGCYTDS